MKVVRTFYPVGQGAFYSEAFLEDHINRGLVVYDCGTLYSQALLLSAIDELTKKRRKKIDILFISHFHYDHISQVPFLLKNLQVGIVVLPVVSREIIVDAYLNNYISSRSINSQTLGFIEGFVTRGDRYGDTRIVRVRRINEDEQIKVDVEQPTLYDELIANESSGDIKISSNGSIRFNEWEYIPCNYPNNSAYKLVRILQEFYPALLDALLRQEWGAVRHILASIPFEDIETMYNSVYNDDNEESMIVLSKPLGKCKQTSAYCLYTGDSPFRDKRRYDFVKWFYSKHWNNIGTVQVPHHGADADNIVFQYDLPRTCVACYGTNNRFGHPGRLALINMALSKSWIRLVNEDRKTVFYQELVTDD